MSDPNIVFILTDQERYLPAWPGGFDVPGRQRLQEAGTTFTSHMIASCVCTPSRSTIYGGEHIQRTRVFDNVNFPWANDLPSDLRTIGHRMRDLGYFSAYLGKWHLSRELDTTDMYGGPNPAFRDVLDGYGFSDFVGPGDVIGLTLGGHTSDEVIAAVTRRWLRLRARDLAAEGTPWFLAVNLVNPHDVMFFDTDRPGEPVQKSDVQMMPVVPAPRSPVYAATWDLPLPSTRHERWSEPGRPSAHHEYQEARRYLVGLVPDEDERWQRLQDYYLNCIRESDRQVNAVLDELDNQDFLDDAMVVFTSDHGELGGAHGMSGKGATGYREQNNVPLIIKHPDLDGGATRDAVTSHVDLLPTIVACAGGGDDGLADLPGRDITAVLSPGRSIRRDAVRDGALYSYNMFAYLDAELIRSMAENKVAGQKAGKAAGAGLLQARRDPQRVRRPPPVHALLRAEPAPPARDARGDHHQQRHRAVRPGRRPGRGGQPGRGSRGGGRRDREDERTHEPADRRRGRRRRRRLPPSTRANPVARRSLGPVTRENLEGVMS